MNTERTVTGATRAWQGMERALDSTHQILTLMQKQITDLEKRINRIELWKSAVTRKDPLLDE